MKNIIAFRGVTQYEVLNHCMDLLVEEFQELRHQVQYINLCEPSAVQNLMKNDPEKCDFAIGFNGIGLGWVDGEVSKFDLLGIPYVCYMVDDPLAHKVLREAPKNMLMTCVDRGHVNYMRKDFPQYRTEFLPHAGCPPTQKVKELHERPIDILFSGTYIHLEDVEAKWKAISDEVHWICKNIADYALKYEYLPLPQAMDVILTSYNLNNSSAIKNLIFHMMPSVSSYIRSKRRMALLRTLNDAQIPVHIYGNDWELATGIENHHKNKPLPFSEILKRMADAKIVLNITSCFSEGTHERIFSGMLQSSLVLTDDNEYFRKEGWNNYCLQTYSWLNLEELPERIRHILSHIHDVQGMANKGKETAEEKHTWKSRAQSILQLLESKS
jgi:hypothetical protein